MSASTVVGLGSSASIMSFGLSERRSLNTRTAPDQKLVSCFLALSQPSSVDVIGTEGASFRLYYEGHFSDLVEQYAGGIKDTLPF